MIELYIKAILIIPILIVLGNVVFKHLNIKPEVSAISSAVGMFFAFVVSWFMVFSIADDGKFVFSLWNWVVFDGQSIGFSMVVDEISSLIILIITGAITTLLSYGIKTEGLKTIRHNIYYGLLLFFLMLMVLSENLIVYSFGLMGTTSTVFLLLIRKDDMLERKTALFEAFRTNLICNFLIVFGLIGIWIVTKNPTFLLNKVDFSSLQSESDRLLLLVSVGLPLAGIVIKSSLFPFSLWSTRISVGHVPVLASIICLLIPIESIFLLTRLSHILVSIPLLLNILVWVAAISIVLMGLLAVVQKSIVRTAVIWITILNGSSILACGVGAFSSALFQTCVLLVVGVFVFLATDLVRTQDTETDSVEKFRCHSLKKRRPEAYWTYLISLIVLAGVPGFSMFFTRENILWSLANIDATRSTAPYWAMIFSSLLLVFSVSKIFFKAFWQRPDEKSLEGEIKKISLFQLLPVILLGIVSLFMGYLNIPHMFTHDSDRLLQKYFEKSVVASIEARKSEHIELLQMIFFNLSLVLVIGLAYLRYVHIRAGFFLKRIVTKTSYLWEWLINFLYVEKVYQWGKLIFKETILKLFYLLEKKVINKLLSFTELIIDKSSVGFEKIKSSKTEVHGLYIVMSILVFVAYIIFYICDKLLVL